MLNKGNNNKEFAKLSILKQSSIKNQLSLRRKNMNDQSMTSLASSDIDERKSTMKNIPHLVNQHKNL